MPTKKKLQRHPYWEERLKLYLDNRREESFEWGLFDCALFAAGAVKAVTDVDVSQDFVGKYDSARAAADFLKQKKWDTLHKAASLKLGKALHPSMARKGDIVMRDGDSLAGKALGVCCGQFSWFVGEIPSAQVTMPDGSTQTIWKRGLIHWPTLQCTNAWRVG